MTECQLSSHLLSLTASQQMVESNVFGTLLQTALKLIRCFEARNKKFVDSGSKLDILLQVGWSWAPLTTVSNFVMIKKCIFALQEFLEICSNEVYYNPEWQQQISGNSTGKRGPRIDWKLSTWQRFARIWQPSLQTSIYLKVWWG